VKRLELDEHVAQYLPPNRMFPAVSQGAVAVQTRANDEATTRWISPLDHNETRLATTAERALLRTLEGGCQVPVGGLATVEAGELRLSAAICSLDGSIVVEGANSGPEQDCVKIGRELAEDLLSRGGAGILQGIRNQQGD
jgi:hydroxymethylbilane synthase